MSGVLRTGALERAGIVVAVATVHVSAFSLLALKPIPDVLNNASEPLFIELIDLAPEPIAPLPIIEAQLELPPRGTGIDLRRDPLPLPAPNAFPHLRELGRSDPAAPITIVPDPAPPQMADAAPILPPMPSQQAQAALRSLLCERLSASEEADCKDGLGAGDRRGLASGGPVMASVGPGMGGRAIRRGEPAIAQPFQMASLDTFAARQGDKFAGSPYRSAVGHAPSRGDTFTHAQGAASFGTQATRDMSMRATSRPHEVWAD